MKDILNLSASNATARAPQSILVADEEWIGGLTEDDRVLVPDMQILALGRDRDLSREHLRGVELAILEVDASVPATLDRLAAVKRMRPDLAVIAAVKNADLQVMRTLLHHGVSDAVALPFDAAQLTTEVYNIGAKLAVSREQPLAPSLCFLGALGRAGTTSILLHTAHALVAQAGHRLRCCLLDLDLQSGQLASHAGVETSRSIQSLLEAQDRLDQDMIRNVAARSAEGVYIISAPSEILPIEQVDIDQLLRIVALARAEFDVVLLDMPRAWTNWSLSIAAEAERVVLVTEQSLTHLRQARRCLELFGEVGLRKDKVKVVVNRVAKSRFHAITVGDVEETLDREVIATIREDRGELAQAIDEGRLVTSIARKNVFALDISDLAASLLDMMAGEPS